MKNSRYSHLRFEEREVLTLGLEMGLSLRQIAQQIGRSPSTLSREVRRNRMCDEAPYRAVPAQNNALRRVWKARRPKKLDDPWLWRFVQRALRQRWSPEQIAGHLRKRYPHDMTRQVSHETIYATIYVMPRGQLRKELLSYLRQAHKSRRPRSRGKDRRGQIPNMVSIHDRPPEVETRIVPGHWEGDLIKGTVSSSAVGTLVERQSRLTLLVKLDDSTAPTTCRAFSRKLRRVPAPMRKTLTYDRGKEMSDHEKLSRALSIKVYFADPYSPWQRGTNENTNGLLRQYLPKGMDLSTVSQRELNRIAHQLNTRPRKTLGFSTPLEAYEELGRVALGI
jgi:IS30 family transposase